MKLLKILGTLAIIALVGIGTVSIMSGAIKYLNESSALLNAGIIGLALAGLITIAYKGIQVIWKI